MWWGDAQNILNLILKFKVTPYESRQKGSLDLPIFRIGYGSWSVKVKGAQLWNNMHQNINTLRLRQDGRHFADDIFKCIFLNENVSIAIKISLKFVPKGPINNNLALVQIMAWRRPGDKPLSEPMMVSLPTHICVTRPQWVKKHKSSLKKGLY